MTVLIQNELLVAIDDGRTVVTPPDLICVLDQENAQPITTEMLAYGQRVEVVALPAARQWRRDGFLDLVGPAAFGYDLDYVPFGGAELMLRIGIDVGGTNTDGVVVDQDGSVLVARKTSTTPEPLDGIRAVLGELLTGVDRSTIGLAMLGTTHPANAIIQRRELGRVGVLRLAAPASFAVRPGVTWPADLSAAVLGPTSIVGGGFEYDGRPIAALDEDAIRRFAGDCAAVGVDGIAVTGVFVPASAEQERRAAEVLAEELGDAVPVSLSHRVGSIGLLERENATILNAALHGVARAVVDGFGAALAEHSLSAAAYLTQNDGTLMSAEEAVRLPVLTLGSGPTNSMRGACALAGICDAVVIDVGGTSADAGPAVRSTAWAFRT